MQRIQAFRAWLEKLFRKPSNEITLLLMSRGHLDVRKWHLSVRTQMALKWSAVVLVAFFVFSGFFLFHSLWSLPERALIESENRALRSELNRLQYHLDTLQVSIDRMTRFDQKLRALTNIGQSIKKRVDPQSVDGGSSGDMPSNFDFGDFQVDATKIEMDQESSRFLDRSEIFFVQKLYSWTRRLFWQGELQEQSLEELYEVLKDRDNELTFTPSVIPVNGWVTSRFGYRIDPFSGRRTLHKGWDIAANKGAPVASPAEGTVTFQGTYGTYGTAIMVFHGYGMSTLYAHLDDVYVKVGQRLKRGELIGTVGSSGRSTGPHVHYEVIVHGVAVDPSKYVLDRSL